MKLSATYFLNIHEFKPHGSEPSVHIEKKTEEGFQDGS
jgi:hypothetical protein